MIPSARTWDYREMEAFAIAYDEGRLVARLVDYYRTVHFRRPSTVHDASPIGTE